jgi:hypothetical protein
MATETVYIKGKLSWVKTHIPDEWGKWKCTVHPDAEGLEKIRELQGQGIKNVLKKDDDGYKTSFSRPTQKMIKGKVQGLAPVEVLKKDGTPLVECLIGNGSDGVVKLEVYEHGTPGGGKAKAARLQAIRVDNLIPFTVDKSFDNKQKETVEGLMEQPEMIF